MNGRRQQRRQLRVGQRKLGQGYLREPDMGRTTGRQQHLDALDKESSGPAAVSFHPHIFGSVGVNDRILNWGDEIPTLTVLKHVPGARQGLSVVWSLRCDVRYTILDNLNVFMLNGTPMVVTR